MQTDLDTMRAVVTRLYENHRHYRSAGWPITRLARSEPGRSLEFQDIDLTELARDVTLEMLVGSQEQGHRSGFEGGDPLLVRGEHVLLHELIANVVHNAIVYTQRGAV
jgi:two-component system sensor histidine kinase TctE